uniref:hypothetical protein n=1 Tax=Goniotrichopsis reniformis TaxID=468933 RepID=UPI001FCCD150|nr:hypothetical protein MW428_pgp149 [Goniotrichopsis reniformis]UNJ14749.1 hypothetical protein [Goniotrichopsis reniformis]
MEIILLGERFPTAQSSRQIASVAIRFDNYSEVCLFDCGESTQHYLLRSYLKNRHIKRILISELNSDSCLGIIGLLATFSLNERFDSLEIYGPWTFCKYLRLFSRYSQTNFSYPLQIMAVSLGLVCQFSNYRIITFPLITNQSIFGYSIIEQEKLGKFRINQAQALKIPLGPIYGFLKQKTRFLLNNGYVINGKNFCESPRRGRKLTYITCFSPRKNIEHAIKKTDLLLLNNSKIDFTNETYINTSQFISSQTRYLISLDKQVKQVRDSYYILIYRLTRKASYRKNFIFNHFCILKLTAQYLLEKISIKRRQNRR